MNHPEIPDGAHVCMGGKKSKNIAHIYINDEEFERKQCLCGRTVVPVIEFEHWDVSQKIIREHTCPDCLERLKLARYLKK